MYNLWMAGRVSEANALQISISRCEIGFGQSSINGTKWVVAHNLGYPLTSSHCRRPYPKFQDEKKKAWLSTTMETCRHIEVALAKT